MRPCVNQVCLMNRFTIRHNTRNNTACKPLHLRFDDLGNGCGLFVRYMRPMQASVPYLEMLERWIYHGNLNDQYGKSFYKSSSTPHAFLLTKLLHALSMGARAVLARFCAMSQVDERLHENRVVTGTIIFCHLCIPEWYRFKVCACLVRGGNVSTVVAHESSQYAFDICANLRQRVCLGLVPLAVFLNNTGQSIGMWSTLQGSLRCCAGFEFTPKSFPMLWDRGHYR